MLSCDRFLLLQADKKKKSQAEEQLAKEASREKHELEVEKVTTNQAFPHPLLDRFAPLPS